MKKFALLLLILFPSIVFATPDTIESTVCFQNASGQCLANGTITFQLSQPAKITSGGGQVAPNFVTVTLDSNGEIPAGTTLWGNDQLTPSGTGYTVIIRDSGSNVVSGPFVWSITGTSPIDLSQEVPTSNGVSYPNACNTVSCSGTYPGNPTFSGIPILSNGLVTSAINGIILVDGTTYTLASAITEANSTGNQTIVLPSNVTISSGLTISGNHITLRCENGGTISAGATPLNLLILTGSNDTVENCNFSAGAFTNVEPIYLNAATNATVSGNYASGFGGASGYASLVHMTGATGSVIRDNRVVAGASSAGSIEGKSNTTSTLVTGNVIDQTAGGSAIVFTSDATGDTFDDTTIVNNQVQEGSGFCVEVGAFGGNPSARLVVSNNVCKLTANANGGYSLADVPNYFSASNNTYDSNGFSTVSSCIEIANDQNGSVTGNVCHGGKIWLNSSSENIVVSSNVISSFVSLAGIALGQSTSGSLSDNTIIGNNITLPAGTSGVFGIWQQCNATGAVCSNNLYANNTIISDGSTGTVGIKFENDTGTSAGEVLGSNVIKSPVSAYSFGAGVTFAKIEQSGAQALSGGAATVTFPAAYDAAPGICAATDSSAAAAVKASCTATQMTLAGTSTDTLNWMASTTP